MGIIFRKKKEDNETLEHEASAASSIQKAWRKNKQSDPIELKGSGEAHFGFWRQESIHLIEHGIDECIENPSLIPVDARISETESVAGMWGAFYYKAKELNKHVRVPGFVVEPCTIEPVSANDMFCGIMRSSSLIDLSHDIAAKMESSMKRFKLARMLYEICNKVTEGKEVVIPRTVSLHSLLTNGENTTTCKISWVPGVPGRDKSKTTTDVGSGTLKNVDSVSGKQLNNKDCNVSMSDEQIVTAVNEFVADASKSGASIQDAYATGTWRKETNVKKLEVLSQAFKAHGIHVQKLDHRDEALYGSRALLLAMAPYLHGKNSLLSYEFGRGTLQVVRYTRVSAPKK